MVVDKKEALVIESKHEREEKANISIGFSFYSNSESIVLSYASIFEVVYNQSVLFQQLKDEDNIKTEFINIAAHESNSYNAHTKRYGNPRRKAG